MTSSPALLAALPCTPRELFIAGQALAYTLALKRASLLVGVFCLETP